MSDIRVAFVMATWHDDLVDRTKLGFFERMAELGHGEDAIDVHKLPGASSSRCTARSWPRPEGTT